MKLKEPLPVTGTSELMVLVIITCIAAVAIWEVGKAIYTSCVPLIFGTKKSRRIKKLRELAKLAAEAEVEKWLEADGKPQEEEVVRGVRRALRSASSDPGPERAPAATDDPDDGPDDPVADPPRTQREQTPTPTTRTSIFGFERPPTPPIPTFDQDLRERERVVKDVLQLMTVHHLREALTQEGLPVSGIKDDLVLRLGTRLGTEDNFPSALPTTRQLRYLLYIWRHRRLAGRTQIRWNILTSPEVISAWISHWKDS